MYSKKVQYPQTERIREQRGMLGTGELKKASKEDFLYVKKDQASLTKHLDKASGLRLVVVGCTHGEHKSVCWPSGDILIHTGMLAAP